MGEIAEMMMEGTLCESCGGYMGSEGEGFPRLCNDCGGGKTRSPKEFECPAPGCMKAFDTKFARRTHLADKHKLKYGKGGALVPWSRSTEARK